MSRYVLLYYICVHIKFVIELFLLLLRGEDILMILTDVGGEVSEKEGCIGRGMSRQISKQMPEVTSRLRSRLVLHVPSTL